MNGKVLKISNNDLNGNNDDRKIAVFAAFIHKKYMNKYAIFAFENELDKKKLAFGSIHLKNDSLVTFDVRPNEKDFINTFVSQYLDNKIDESEYEIIDISNISKIELVSYGQEDFDKLADLDKLSIKRVVNNEEVDNKKGYGMLYFIIMVLILLLGGITYLYFNPDLFDVELKQLNCSKEGFNEIVELNYTSEAELKFNRKDEIDTFNKIDTYTFNNEEDYLNFKGNNEESKYFNINGAYKYNDNKLELKLIYTDKLVIYKYDEVLKYLENNGYTCVEGTYNE